MPNQDKLDRTYMSMANQLAQLSHATRAKVGCLVVKDTHIIAEGYNGMPSGFDNECEITTPDDLTITNPEVLHAESNAIAKLAKSSNSSLGATLYVTLSPCLECAKLILQAGITRVVYKKAYTDTQPLEFLKQGGIEVDQL